MLELRPAGLAVRLYAFLVDLLIRLGIIYVVVIATMILGSVGLALSFIGVFLLEWFYPVAFELTRSGATPGKRVFGLTVVMDTGLPVTPAASITRNLLRTADFLPLMYGAGIACMLLRRDFKRLGDVAAGTCVVYRLDRPSRSSLGTIEPQPPAMPLAPRAQAAVIAFATRLPRLTSERAEELAALAAPAAGERDGGSLTEKLVAVAQWLLGRRRA
jgi:uncharacterized RDD family membrane protein YckC